jgi:MerR family transcriptional regulator, mercuric resistance operon regulatory protein
MAEHKLNDVRAKMFDLRRMETALEVLIADCCATKGTVLCPLIAALQDDDVS